MNINKFDDIRPFNNYEISPAMHRITNDPLFEEIVDFLYPGASVESVEAKFLNINSIDTFQEDIMDYAIKFIAKRTMSGFSWNGQENLEKDAAYLFVSNHRDILLDSALLQIVLHDCGFKTSEITFGSNLMRPDIVVDIGKSNKMFKVERGGTPRDFYKNSKHLSEYIRYTIKEKKESVWIAQRNGRTKDGNDFTDHGLLKMFSMSGDTNLQQNIDELHIVPISISYQIEPCAISKVNELYKSREGKYSKAPNEDLQSILTGITQQKGSVHYEITRPVLAGNLIPYDAVVSKNEIISKLCETIDKQIHVGYKLFDTNYIAYDLLSGAKTYLNKEYSEITRLKFISEMKKHLSVLEGEKDELQAIYLGIYANPVANKLSGIG
jgi:hypothetical protein